MLFSVCSMLPSYTRIKDEYVVVFISLLTDECFSELHLHSSDGSASVFEVGIGFSVHFFNFWHSGAITQDYYTELSAVYSAPVRVRSIVINPSACLSVCLSASISLKSLDRSSRNFVCRSLWPRGSVLLWRRCATLCTSGFMDDVMFSRNVEAAAAASCSDGHERCGDTGTESDACLWMLSCSCDREIRRSGRRRRYLCPNSWLFHECGYCVNANCIHTLCELGKLL